MNQAVQQKKVATIVSQLQNTGSAPNLATTMVASLHHKNDAKSDRDKETETPELSTFDDVSYIHRIFNFLSTDPFVSSPLSLLLYLRGNIDTYSTDEPT